MQRSMITDNSDEDEEVAFVDLVRLDLEKILDETDRDECEILITKPDFLEMTDESKIPAYQVSRVINLQGSRVINQVIHAFYYLHLACVFGWL